MAQPAHTLSLDGDSVRIPAEAFEQDGFRRWLGSSGFPEHARASFAEGEVFVDMSPESIEVHNKVKTIVTVELGGLIRREDLGEFYSDRALLTNDTAGLSTEPDAIFAGWETLESGRLRLGPGDVDGIELIGVPDLVVEIVSPSSVRKDTVTLRAAYARATIPEYWLIDARGEQLKFEILRLDNGTYTAADRPDSPQRSSVLARTFVLERDRNRVGRWTYRLTSLS